MTFFLELNIYSILSCTFYLIYFFVLLLFLFLLHFILFSYLYLCIFSCVCVTYNCTVHGADLTYISLRIIFCIIVYVTNKNLESIHKGSGWTGERGRKIQFSMICPFQYYKPYFERTSTWFPCKHCIHTACFVQYCSSTGKVKRLQRESESSTDLVQDTAVKKSAVKKHPNTS